MMIQLYNNIKKRRIELGMTQSELASKLGYADKSMIAKIEKGSIDLPQSKIMAFADALLISASDLMGWDDTNDTPLLRPDEHILLEYYNQLNDTGKESARERIKEMTELKKYTEEGTSQNLSSGF